MVRIVIVACWQICMNRHKIFRFLDFCPFKMIKNNVCIQYTCYILIYFYLTVILQIFITATCLCDTKNPNFTLLITKVKLKLKLLALLSEIESHSTMFYDDVIHVFSCVKPWLINN
jgi:hypothetical protein